jgi:hypothetical protein
VLGGTADAAHGDTRADHNMQSQLFLCHARGGLPRRLARFHPATGESVVARIVTATLDQRERVILDDHDAGAHGPRCEPATGGAIRSAQTARSPHSSRVDEGEDRLAEGIDLGRAEALDRLQLLRGRRELGRHIA